jgi:PAS domain S-box-containing protein
MTLGASISALFEAAHDAVVLADGAGTVLGVNTAAERLFGYPRDELIVRRLGELLIAEELGVPVETAVVRKDGVRDLSKEREQSELDGRWRRLRDFVRLTRDENGTVVRARGVAVDMERV